MNFWKFLIVERLNEEKVFDLNAILEIETNAFQSKMKIFFCKINIWRQLNFWKFLIIEWKKEGFYLSAKY